MKHFKKSLLFIVCAVVGFFILFAFTEGLAKLLIFPIIALFAFCAMYLVKQADKDVENNIKDGVRYTVEDQEAEQWIKHDLAPHTLSYIQHKHWPVIIYGFIFVVGIAYFWSYLTAGEVSALRNTVYAAVLFGILVAYAFLAPKLFNALFMHIPKKHRKLARNDWVRGYLFLLPLTAIAYVLSPFLSPEGEMAQRIMGLPGFILGYTFLFLCGYAIMYLHKESKKEEQKELKKSIKEYLNNK